MWLNFPVILEMIWCLEEIKLSVFFYSEYTMEVSGKNKPWSYCYGLFWVKLSPNPPPCYIYLSHYTVPKPSYVKL